jgi:hypothetical protein
VLSAKIGTNRYKLNNHQLKAGGLLIGGLNRRLEEKTTESRWFLTTSYRTFVRAKAALMENKITEYWLSFSV